MWERTKNMSDKLEFKSLQIEVKELLKLHRSENWKNRLLQINKSNVWQATKRLKNKNNIFKIPNLDTNSPDQDVQSDQQKAEILAASFEKVHGIDLQNLNAFQTQVQNSVTDYLQNTNSNNEWQQFLATPKSRVNIIKSFRNKKAPGPDQISNLMLKRFSRKAIVKLTMIFTFSKVLENGYDDTGT